MTGYGLAHDVSEVVASDVMLPYNLRNHEEISGWIRIRYDDLDFSALFNSENLL